MPTLSHVTPNEPATNYRWRGVWTPGGGAVGTIGVQSNGSSVITWGVAYPGEGIQVVAWAYDPAVGVAGGEIRFSSPWFADQFVTLLSYVGGTWEVEIDDLVLDRAGCTGSSWSYSEVRLYIDGVLIFTGGANSGSSSSYDHRYNRCRLAASTIFNPDMVCNPAACPGANLTIWPTSRVVGGYQRDTGSGFGSDAVLIDPTGYTTPLAIVTCPSACGCFPTAPSITGTDSYSVEVYGERKYLATASSGSRDCLCLDGSSGGTVTTYQADEDAIDNATWVHIVGEDHGIPTRVVSQRSCCNCVCPAYTDSDCRLVSTTIVGTKTYCESYRSSTGWLDTVYCWSGMVVCPDPPGAGTCGEGDDVFCAFDAYVHVYWPADSCGDCDDPSYDVNRAFDHIRSTICNTNQVWFGYASHSNPASWTDANTGITATSASIRFDHLSGGSRISLVTVNAGALEFRYSEDGGVSWEAPVTVQTSVVDGCHEINKDGRRIFVYIVGTTLKSQVWDAQDAVLISETTIDTGVETTKPDVREYPSASGGWLIGLTYRKAGALLYKTSPDGVNFT